MSSIAFYTGATGMRAYQSAMDVTAHNIANVNTYGYKAQRAGFSDLLRSRINTRVEGNLMVGHGVKQGHVDLLMQQSGLDQTLQPLDFAIVGDGYFAVDNRGQREYTRNGAFGLSIEGANATLVTNDGAYVLDRNGNRITLNRGTDGSYIVDDLAGRVGVYGFANEFGLAPRSNQRYVESPISGAAELLAGQGANQRYELKQYALEFSGVDLGKEMVSVIFNQRAFQMNSRVVQTADQMADLVNNLR